MLKTFKLRLRNFLQAFFARRGLALLRIPAGEGIPPSLVEYLKSLPERRIIIRDFLSFDDEPEIQKELLSVFPVDRVVFASRPASSSVGFPLAASLKHPQKAFAVEVDGETYDLRKLAEEMPWLFEAEIILIRTSPGFFWSGDGDLSRLVQFLNGRGYDFYDSLEYFRLLTFNAQAGRIIFIFEKQKTTLSGNNQQGSWRDKMRLGRIDKSLTFLSNPIARSSNLVRLTGRSSFGFAAGVLNPGAIADGDNIILLARGEHFPWAVSKQNMTVFLSGCRPMLFELNKTLAVTAANEAAFSNVRENGGARLEDFRLFRYGERMFSNHSRFTLLNGDPVDENPVDFKSLRTAVGISEVDVAVRKMTFLGTPTLDYPTGLAEKNWAMFEHQKELYLIYSFNPFHLLRANDWPRLSFKTVTRQKFKLSDNPVPFRNSVNPVEYNGDFFLHVVHKVYPGKQYAFWAVLIEKATLLPKMISGRPLVCGWKSVPAAIIYACALVAQEKDILIFGGINDTSMGFWKISRSLLDESWVPLNQTGL